MRHSSQRYGQGENVGSWQNWAGNVTARSARDARPASVEELRAVVRQAAEDGLAVKAVGSGHSFSAAAVTDGVLIRPDRLTGIRAIDRAAGTVTVEAGTRLRTLNMALAQEGLSLTNMGDIMEQTVAGATSTGTHGTGRDSGALSAQIRGLELVTADGSLLTCSRTENPEVFAAARIGLGALGVITAITFAVEPLFLLSAREEPMTFDRVTATFDELHADNDHFEFYWFPHTDNCITLRNNRTVGPHAPLGRLRGWFEDEFLANGVFQALNSVGRAVPSAVPAIARLASRSLAGRTYTDIPYKVFTSPRRVRMIEMEYAVPREAAVDTLRELKAMVDRSDLRISFPVEVRAVPADDITLSTASERDSAYIAVHVYRGMPYRRYFTEAERIFAAHDGRPHWGKLHTRDADYFADAYPRFAEFTALRDRLDPDRRFANPYLRGVLGD
ncbi:FAD-binding protein [Streptomyces sp. uw30]|nr:FAD-binding protein [Streptomyces sp. uw30]